MPLSKARNRERMRQSRLHKPNVQPKQVKISELRELIASKQTNSRLHNEPVQPNLPIYRAGERYEAGQHILVQRGKKLVETVVPELDADGHPVPDFT